jgi:hypothetical protein
MDYETIINDAIEFTRQTFAGRWDRWLILALLGLPFTLTRFFIVPEKIITKGGINWEMIPWVPIAALGIAGILASFFIAGYMVRIYRGPRPIPGLTGWPFLFADGIKVDIVILTWFLPALVVLLTGGVMLIGMLTSPSGLHFNPGFFLLMILLLPVELILFLIGSFFSIPGAIRFARTGSIVEGWRFSAILAIIRKIGWWHYLIALVILMIAGFFYSMASLLPSSIPYVGWLVPVALAPFFTVFSAWYLTLVYEAGIEPAPVPAGTPGP